MYTLNKKFILIKKRKIFKKFIKKKKKVLKSLILNN